jgi:hypothetical protein
VVRSRTFILTAVEAVGMLREVLTAVCIAEVLAPATLIEYAGRVSLDNAEECEWRSWVVPVARLEGAVILWSMWRSAGTYSAFKRFLGLLGLLLFAFPRAYVDYGSAVAFTGDTTPEWKPWVYRVTRLFGLLYVAVALRESRRD